MCVCEDKRRLVSLEVVEVLQHMLKFQILSHLLKRGAAVAQWICLCLPYCHRGFKSQCTPATLLSFLSNLCYICHVKRTQINKKRPGLAHLLKKSLVNRSMYITG